MAGSSPPSSLSRRTILQSLGAAGVAGVTGCLDGAPSARGETDVETELVVGLPASITHFDPVRINDAISEMCVRTLVYEGLTTIDAEGEVHPALAAAWEQVDDVTFRFHLREGVLFHNGEDLHAGLVKRSFERFVESAENADVNEWYEGSEVVDDLTIDVEMKRPDATFLAGVGTAVLPIELLDGETDPNERPIGTGAYRFEEYREGSLFRVRRFDEHWFEGGNGVPATPPIERVTLRIIPEDAARSAALQTGDVDLTFGLTTSTIDDFDADENYTVTSTISGGYEMLVYPVQFSPWNDPTLRRGVNHLIPREIVVEQVLGGWATEAYAPISPVAEGFSPPSFQAEMKEAYGEYDVERGSRLVEEALAAAGVEPPLDARIVTTSDSDDLVRWTELVRESMNDTGLFEVDLETYEWGSLVTRVLGEDSKDNEELVAVGLSAGFDPDGYLRSTMHPSRSTPGCCNIHHFEHDELTELIDIGRYDPDVAFDLDRRSEVYREVQDLALSLSPLSFVAFGSEIDVARSDVVRDWATYPINGAKLIGGLYHPQSGQAARVERS